jgi:hypothetical protein
MGTRKRFRSIAVIASAALILGAFIAPADAAKKKTKRTERTVEATYLGAPSSAIGACFRDHGIGCASFPSKPKERYVSIEIADTLLAPVFAVVYEDADGDGLGTWVAAICGESVEPIPITRGAEVIVVIWGEQPPEDCPGAFSSGTIKTTFSNLP